MKRLLFVILFIGSISYGNHFRDFFYSVSGKIDQTLIVSKKQQQLYVVSENSDRQMDIVARFRVTTGKAYGDKEKEGDLRTPEGIYTVVKKLNGNRLPEKYGPLAFVLDYPNYVDRINRKTGSNIWIHGRNEKIKDRQTEGCISLENSHILDLAEYIRIRKTNVVVVDSFNTTLYDSDAYKLQLEKFVAEWASAWSDGDLEKYFTKYSKKFKENGHSFEVFKRRKKRLEKLYKWKQVKLDSLSFILSKKEVIANFQQTYISPRFTSIGKKQLIIIQENGHPKIVKEDFRRTGDRINAIDEINRFITRWEKAWESVDIDNYMRFYSQKFQYHDKDRDWWMADKKEKFSKVKTIQVKTSHISTNSIKENQWIVRFNQKYEADNYKDYGVKTMIVEKDSTNTYKIINEMWRAK